MASKSKFILCENGSYLLVRNITRLFIQEDALKRTFMIRASTIGPAMPFAVAIFQSKKEAAKALQDLVDRIENS